MSDAEKVHPDPRQGRSLVWEGGEVFLSQCSFCARYRPSPAPHRTGYCAAFPGGIPDAILSNQVDHRRPYLDPETGAPADMGIPLERSITFEPRDDVEPETLKRLYATLDALKAR